MAASVPPIRCPLGSPLITLFLKSGTELEFGGEQIKAIADDVAAKHAV